MSWTVDFPLLTDEHECGYAEHATPGEKEQLQQLFAYRRMGGPRPAGNLIALSLSPEIRLSAPASAESESGGFLTGTSEARGETLMQEELVDLILAASLLLALCPVEVTIRVYLDPVWENLSSFLIEGGCEVMLMDHASDGPNPAKLWRYLALEESGKTVTFIGIQDLLIAENYVNRAELLVRSGLKIWRMPLDRPINYRPVHPDRFASSQFYPVLGLLCAYVWHLRFQATFSEAEAPPLQDGESRAAWENEDLDESFLLSTLFPRMAFDGMITLIETDDKHSRWLLLDIEYATWANPASEIVFVRREAPPPRLVDLCEGFLSSALIESLLLPNPDPPNTTPASPHP